MSSTAQDTDRIVCHCLGIREGAIRHAVEVGGSQCVRDVMAQTEAGTGCTACQARIRALLQRQPESQPAASSPICWAT
jgi:NAD(P)H-nitrite reductase large subunit